MNILNYLATYQGYLESASAGVDNTCVNGRDSIYLHAGALSQEILIPDHSIDINTAKLFDK